MSPALHLSVASSLVLTFFLTVGTAGTLSVLSPLIGTPVTGASVPIFGWSLEVGDLRVAHFLSTHAMHVIPLVVFVLGATQRRAAVLSAVGFLVLTVGVFIQALAGYPVLPLG